MPDYDEPSFATKAQCPVVTNPQVTAESGNRPGAGLNESSRYFPVSMLLLRDGAGWAAVAIEADISVHGPHPNELIARLVEDVGAALVADIDAGRPPRRAAHAWWDVFHAVMQGGRARSPETADRDDQLAVPALFVITWEPGRPGSATWRHLQGTIVGTRLARGLGMTPLPVERRVRKRTTVD
jgi:hypothetical protein